MIRCDQCQNVFDGEAAEARGWLLGVRRGNEIVDLCPEHRGQDDETRLAHEATRQQAPQDNCESFGAGQV